MVEPADRLVARAARQIVGRFNHRGDRVERSPVPWPSRSEDSDGRCAERSGDGQQTGIVRYRAIRRGERENGVAQVGPGEVADIACSSNFSGDLVFVWSADHPYPVTLDGKPAGEIGVECGGPALGGADGPGGERNNGPTGGREPQPAAPIRAFGRPPPEAGQRPFSPFRLT